MGANKISGPDFKIRATNLKKQATNFAPLKTRFENALKVWTNTDRRIPYRRAGMWCRLFYEHFFSNLLCTLLQGSPRGGRGVVGIPADDNAVGGYDVNSLVVAVGFTVSMSFITPSIWSVRNGSTGRSFSP